MNSKEKQILHMLQQGKTYLEIQTALQVSPTKISKVKKEYYSRNSVDEDDYFDDTTGLRMCNDEGYDENDSDDDSGDFSDDDTGDDSDDFGSNHPRRDSSTAPCGSNNLNSIGHSKYNPGGFIPNENSNRFINQKNNNIMTDDLFNLDNLDPYERAEIIKKKLEMQHELDKANIEITKKAQQIEQEKLQIVERQKASALVARFRKLAEKIEDGEWAISEIQSLYDKLTNLKFDVENFCNEFDIYSEGLKIIIQICRIEETLQEILNDGSEEDDVIEFDFDDELHDIREGARKLNFYDYE